MTTIHSCVPVCCIWDMIINRVAPFVWNSVGVPPQRITRLTIVITVLSSLLWLKCKVKQEQKGKWGSWSIILSQAMITTVILESSIKRAEWIDLTAFREPAGGSCKQQLRSLWQRGVCSWPAVCGTRRPMAHEIPSWNAASRRPRWRYEFQHDRPEPRYSFYALWTTNSCFRKRRSSISCSMSLREWIFHILYSRMRPD